MNTQIKSLREISLEAHRLLYEHLGIANTIRFLNQFNGGLGDYTKERDSTGGAKNVDDLAEKIRKFKRGQDTLAS